MRGMWIDDRLIETYMKLFKDNYGTTPEFCTGPFCSNYRATLGSKFADKIWKPDFYFSRTTAIEPTDDYNDNVCVRLESNGRVFWSQRFLITTSCPMRMTYFPFDRHVCSIAIGSYKYHDGLVNLTLAENLSGMYPGQETSNFIFKDLDAKNDVMRISAPYMDDVFSEQNMFLYMTRKYGLFFTQLFLPSLSLTVLRWVTFWINPRCLPERATISITVILAQVVLIFGIAAQYPSVSDLKMADIYVIMNFIFNFAGLIENILAAHFWVKTDKEVSVEKSIVDFISSITFPVTFVIWNIVFFGYNIFALDA
ncbi:glycine receptor subunit alpha-2-like [Convolutriloba macropyga]|uniref:glycine receptor subunit alpha-2-like n=1 Tax=Convolutriloba macropyga TaxID=536237 RepID=UPI003F51D4C6